LKVQIVLHHDCTNSPDRATAQVARLPVVWHIIGENSARQRTRHVDLSAHSIVFTMKRGQGRSVRQAIIVSAVIAGVFELASAATSLTAASPESLRHSVAAGAATDRKARSRALFLEMADVIESPRCLNCHPADRHPTQGDDMHIHNPPMVTDGAGHGMPGMNCSQCHGAANFRTNLPRVKSIPGNPRWALAPAEFAWQHKSLQQICEQIKDPTRNGNRTLAQIQEHLAHDKLVGWSWHPGVGRKPAPGTQARFGEVVQTWIDTGSECPTP
jgi:hypothetical protein